LPHDGGDETVVSHAAWLNSVRTAVIGLNLKANLAAIVDPAATDDTAAGYVVGSRWINVTAGTVWVAVDVTAGAAVWKDLSAGAGGGEANTASNIGTVGQGLFKQKTGVDLEFYKINSLTAAFVIALDAANNKIDLSVANAVAAGAAGLMTGADKSKLDGVAAGANAYVHPNHSGDVTSVGDGAQTIAAKAVTLAKMADMATASLLGRSTAGAGSPEALSKATALALLNVADGAQVNAALASQADAEAGTENTKMMTALRTAQAIAKQAMPLGEVAGVNEQTVGPDYTLVLGDKGFVIEMNVAGAGNNDLLVPTNAAVAFPVNTIIHVMQKSTAQTTIQAVTPGTTTIHSTATTAPTAPKLRAQWATATLRKIAADEWVVSGEIDTA